MLRFGLILIGLALAWPVQAAVTVRVDIAGQAMQVDASTGETYRWRISTGREGYRTPTGVYRPQRLERFWRSRRYGNAPMPHAIFFRGGYAIHGTTDTGRLGRPASHGCIRLHPTNAATLFRLVQQNAKGGTRIVITGARTDPAGPRAERRRPVAHAGNRGAWVPERRFDRTDMRGGSPGFRARYAPVFIEDVEPDFGDILP